MSIGLKSALDGNSGAIQINGSDKVTIDDSGNVTATGPSPTIYVNASTAGEDAALHLVGKNLNGVSGAPIELHAEPDSTSSNGSSRLRIRNRNTNNVYQDAAILDSNGNLTVIGTVGGSSALGFRNKIINGDMRIDQRNAGSSASCGAGTGTFATDRFVVYPSGAAVTAQQTTGSAGYKNALRITGAASNTEVELSQKIEAANCYDLTGAITLSFVASSSSLTTLRCRFRSPTSVDDQFSTLTTVVASPSITINSTPTRYTVTVTPSYSVTHGLQVSIDSLGVGLGAGQTLTITGIQLEAGTVATPFENRPYGLELSLCQRYFSSSFPDNTAPANNLVYEFQSPAVAYSVSNIRGPFIYFPVNMRVLPNITFYRANSGGTVDGQWGAYIGTVWNSTAMASNPSKRGFLYTMTLNSSFTVGTSYLIAGHWTADAEL